MRAIPASLARRPARGVTLIEMMVGMTIGLLAVLVIAQTAILYEGRKRTITSGSDAQVNGALALQALQRDIQAAGYGVAEGGAIGCRIVGLRGTERFEQVLAPVVITDGAGGLPDRIEVLSSDQVDFAVPTRVASGHVRGASTFVVVARTGLGHRRGDLMLAVPSPTPAPDHATQWCSLFSVSATPPAGSNDILHEPAADLPWNHDLVTTIFPGTQSTDVAYPAGSYLLNLGRLTLRSYCIAGLPGGSADTTCDQPSAPSSPFQFRQRTWRSDTGATTADDLNPQVVSLQAVYGRDTSEPADQVADTWDVQRPTTVDGWQRIVAIRVAVVARSIQNEKTARDARDADSDVTTEPPVWHRDGTRAEPIRVDQAGGDWKKYRYKVYETVIPLRNLLWQRS